MKSVFDKLNLRPGERRLVVIVGIVVFIALNALFVIPNFGKYAQVEAKIKKTEVDLRRFDAEVKRKPTYMKQLRELENQGVFVGQEDQALQFASEVTAQAQLTGVTVLRSDPGPRLAGTGRTNAFFDESSLVITINTGEKELIDFLYNLGSRNSLIRVKSMNLGPEPSRMRLQGSMTLVESFQKKPPAKGVPVAATAARPAPAAAKPPPVKAPEKKTETKPAPTKAPDKKVATPPAKAGTNQTTTAKPAKKWYWPF